MEDYKTKLAIIKCSSIGINQIEKCHITKTDQNNIARNARKNFKWNFNGIRIENKQS